MDSNYSKAIILTLLLFGLLPSVSLAAEPSAWAGPYIGIHGGEGEVPYTNITVSGNGSGSFNMHGTYGGAQLGYNLAAGQAVLGLEARGSVSEIDGSAACVGGLVGRCGVKLDRLYTIQAKVGISVGSMLAYLFAGAASGQVEVRDELPTVVYTTSERQTGYLAGVGGVLALGDKINGMIETQYIDFGRNTYTVNDINVDTNIQTFTLSLGINYRF